MKSFDTPILLIAFNRPDTTKRVFEEIRKVKPKKLYIAIDGAREGNIKDLENIELVKNLFKEIDWECSVKTNYSSANKGCGIGVSSAISWVLDSEEYVIILEDDCVPTPAFFYFCDNLLNKYKEADNVYMISGNNYNEEFDMETDYIFSRIAHHIWGWATWKRAWTKFDISKQIYLDFMKNNGFQNLFADKAMNTFFKYRYKKFYTKRKITHTWDFQWNFIITINFGLTIVPKKNLVANIGTEGVHTENKHDFHFRNVLYEITEIKQPDKIEQNINYDIYHFNNHFKKLERKRSLIIKIRNKLIKLFKN